MVNALFLNSSTIRRRSVVCEDTKPTFSIRWHNTRNEKSDQRNKGNESGGWILKECLLCTKELKTGEHFTDLIFMNQQEEWICKECKEDFEQIGEIHCPRCYKDKEEKVCKDCEYWIQKGNMVNHEALYRYNAAMKDYFKRYKFEGDRLLGMVFACEIKKALKKYKSYTIIPTPISHEKKQERGFNLSFLVLGDAMFYGSGA